MESLEEGGGVDPDGVGSHGEGEGGEDDAEKGLDGVACVTANGGGRR